MMAEINFRRKRATMDINYRYEPTQKINHKSLDGAILGVKEPRWNGSTVTLKIFLNFC
jgi:hypothetical protein